MYSEKPNFNTFHWILCKKKMTGSMHICWLPTILSLKFDNLLMIQNWQKSRLFNKTCSSDYVKDCPKILYYKRRLLNVKLMWLYVLREKLIVKNSCIHMSFEISDFKDNIDNMILKEKHIKRLR